MVIRPQTVPNKTVKINVFVTGVPCLQHGCVRRGATQKTLFRKKLLEHQPEEDDLGPRPGTKNDDHGRFQLPTRHPPCNQPPYAKDDLCEAEDSLILVTREIAVTPQPPKR